LSLSAKLWAASLSVCPTNALNPLLKLVNEPTNPKRNPPTTERGPSMTNADAWTEIYLWNLNMDRLIRVLDRLELHSIRSKRELKAYAIRLQEIRAGLNADFAEVMAERERADEFRYWYWRTALEKQRERTN
jgi:hypothetical protein